MYILEMKLKNRIYIYFFYKSDDFLKCLNVAIHIFIFIDLNTFFVRKNKKKQRN